MQSRKLGRNGPTVSAIGLGCMGMSDYYAKPDDTESLATLQAAFDAGVTFFDTADQYGYGKNEELLARWLPGRRDKLVLASKFGFKQDPKSPTGRALDASPTYVREACEASLRRLKVDVIDLYYLHRVDSKTPVEDSVGAMAKLVEEGKVRYLGLSEVAPGTLRRADAVHPIAAVQSEYSLWSRDPEGGILDACRELGVGFVAFSPLGRGFLTGHITKTEDLEPEDLRRGQPRFQGENLQKNLELAALVRMLATERGCSPAQLAIAWVMAQGDSIVPIPGTKRRKYLEDNLGAAVVHLTAADLHRIDQLFPPGAAAGTRYPEAMMAWVDKD